MTNSGSSEANAVRLLTMRAAFLAGSLALVACGPSASLSDLRCDVPCQSPVNPLLLHLTAELADPLEELAGGDIVVELQQAEISRVALSTLNETGTARLRFDVLVPFEWVSDGQVFTLVVRAESGRLRTPDERLSFTVRL